MMEVEVRKSGGHKKPGLRAGAEAGGDCVGGGKRVAPLWRPTGCGGAVVEEERGGCEEEERPHLQSTSTPPLNWLPFRLRHLPTICLNILILCLQMPDTVTNQVKVGHATSVLVLHTKKERSLNLSWLTTSIEIVGKFAEISLSQKIKFFCKKKTPSLG